MELNKMLQGLMGELQKIARSESVAGKAMPFGNAHLVPLCKVSIGFGTGTSELSGSGDKRGGNLEAGGAAGGVTIEPRAFVVVASDGVPQMLSMTGGSATLQHAIELPNKDTEPSGT
ncbi:MAG: spore germination protein GerW family protein [Byssovorax sp.]